MKAMVLESLSCFESNQQPLKLLQLPIPVPNPQQIQLKIASCGVCHTDLDAIEGRSLPASLPIVPGHQVIGHISRLGSEVKGFKLGDRVGVAWIYSACGVCPFCLAGNENLCPNFQGTGRDVNGGYAQYMTVDHRFAFAMPKQFSDLQAAPLLCAGAVGFRALRLTGLKNGQYLGLTGFGASAHLLLKMVKRLLPNSEIYVFTRSESERQFALSLGASWAGNHADLAPNKPDCIIDTTPSWEPVLAALAQLQSGGRLVINALTKQQHPASLRGLDYQTHLWREKEIKTVANVTRSDVRAFLELAVDLAIEPDLEIFSLEQANQALCQLANGQTRGAKVLQIN